MRDFSRMREIASVLARYGLGGFLQRIRLAGRRPCGGADGAGLGTPQRFRLAFEQLGPTFVKFGQILSTRVDVFPPEWIGEFERLQTDVAPICAEDIYTLIAAELGRPVGEVFLEIDPVAAGSASVAQVHRAVLLDGTRVAVKVKRPGIDKTIQADLRILNHLAALIESEIPETRRYRPVQMVQYFAKNLARELDLSFELRHIQRFARAFAGHPFVRIPRVYAEYSGRGLLVQEFVGGTLLSGLAASTLPPEARTVLARRIIDAFFVMMLKHGFFHADPHPGNIFVGRDLDITLIDFGLVGRLSPARRHEIITLIRALMERDQFTMQYVLGNWAQGGLPDEDLLGEDVLEMMMNYEDMPVSELHVSQVINDITQIMRDHDLALPADLVMLFKTLITLEGVVKRLDGSVQLLQQAKPIVLAEIAGRASPRHLLRESRRHLDSLLRTADSLPPTLAKLSHRLQKGRLNINLDLKRLDDLNHQLDRATNRLTMGVVTAALIIGSSIVMGVESAPRFIGFTGYLLAFANSIWIIWSIWRSGKH